MYLWLCWVFVSVWGLSPVAASGGRSSLWCVGLSLSQPLLLRSTGSRHAGSVVVAHGPSCSAACEIFPGQGSNPCPLHWQADSQPLCYQGSPNHILCFILGVLGFQVLTFNSLIHFELFFFVWYKIVVQLHSFVVFSFPNTIYWRSCPFPIV